MLRFLSTQLLSGLVEIDETQIYKKKRWDNGRGREYAINYWIFGIK